jgi:hypothetical protein
VFTRTAIHARAEFHRLPHPEQSDLEDIAINIRARVERGLRRKKLLRDTDEVLFNNETPELTPLDACLEGSLGIGERTCLPEDRASRSATTTEQGVDRDRQPDAHSEASA